MAEKLSFDAYMGWVNITDPNNIPQDARVIGANDLLRYENFGKNAAIAINEMAEVATDEGLASLVANPRSLFGAQMGAVSAKYARSGLASTYRPARPVVAFSFDDGPIQDKTLVLPILDAKGIKGSFGAISTAVGTSGKLSWDDLREMQSAGHEIMNHSATHPTLAGAEASTLESEINGSYKTFVDNGINLTGFIWPNGQSDAASRSVARQRHQYGIGGSGDGLGTKQPLNTYNIGRATMDSSVSVASVQARIDRAITDNEFLIFIVHAGIDFGTSVRNVFSAAIDYAQSKNLPIVTVREGIELVGNVVDAGDLVISGDGTMRPPKGLPVVTPQNTISAATLPNAFQSGVITYSTTNSQGNTDWPVKAQTVNIATDRTNSTGYGYVTQVLTANNGTTFFRRATGGTAWSEWSSPAASLHNVDNAVTAETTPASFPSGKITYSAIGSSANTDWPVTGQTANITTDRTQTSAYGHVLQEFRTANHSYMRRATSGTVWGPWSQPGMAHSDHTLTAATTPVSFPSGKVTYTTVSSGENTDWPVTGVYANITTDRTRSGLSQYIQQEFRSDNQISLRRANGNTSWGPWKTITLT